MRVSHLITTLDIGGAETMLCRLVTGSHSGHAVRHSVICLAQPGKLGRTLQAHGVPLYTLGMGKRLGDMAAVTRLIHALKATRPQLIQTWLYHADLVGLIAGRICKGTRVAWNIRCANMNLDRYSLSTRVVFALLARLSKLPHGIVFNSRAGWRFHAHAGYDTTNAVVIPNGFDTTVFRPNPQVRQTMRRRWGIGAAESVVGMVARFDPMKDHQTFFQAAGALAQRLPRVKYVLVGSGLEPKNPMVSQMIRKNGIESSVILLGEQSRLADIYPGFDIATLSSIGEGFPNVLGEAMSSGIPCVATDAGDAADILDRTGVIVPPGNPHALANGWERLLTLESERRTELGEAARRRIEGHFSLPRIRDRYLSYYQHLLDG